MEFVFDLQRFAGFDLSNNVEVEGYETTTFYCCMYGPTPLYTQNHANARAKVTVSEVIMEQRSNPFNPEDIQDYAIYKPENITSIKMVGNIDGSNMKLPDGKYLTCTVQSGDPEGIDISLENKVVTSITGLNAGEVVTYDGYTYTMGNGSITVTSTTDPSDTKTITGDSSYNLLDAVGSPIEINAHDTTTYFLADGSTTIESDNNKVATLQVDNNQKTLTVTGKVMKGVVSTGATVKVIDQGTDTVYTLASGVKVTAKNASFTTTNGTVSDVTGTLTLKSGSVTTSDADVNFDISTAGNDATVTFATGTAANGAVIKTAAGSITLTESGNAMATVVKKDGSISGLDGTATIILETAGKYSVNGKAYDFATTEASFIAGNRTYLTSGTVSLTSEVSGYSSVDVANAAGDASSNIYVNGGSATVVVADGKYTISNFTDGMSVGVDGATFTYNATNKSLTDGNGKAYKSTDGTFNFTILSGQDVPTSSGLTLDSKTFEDYGDATTLYYDADGKNITENTDSAAVIVKRADTSTTNNYTVTVKSTLSSTLILDGVRATVTDKGTDTEYWIENGPTFTAKGASFTADSDVFSSVTGTLTVTAGTLTTKTGNAKYALAGGEAVVIQQGNSVDTSVTTTTGTITLKENNNKNDTTIKSDGTITGVDGNAEVKGALNGSTIATTGNGTLTINGVSWTVDKDSDGATFTVDTSAKGKISGVTGLDNDATLSTTANVSGLTLNGCTLESAREGVKYTAGNPGIFDFSYAGASITVNGYTYKLKELSDRISIDTQGTITGLTAGEKVIVTNTAGATFTYEVSGETLLINKTDGTGTTIVTNRLAEGELDGFIILQGGREAVNRATDSSVVQTEVGLEVSSQGVDSVTSGMLLDRNGQATNAENKAVATVTISDDDTLKYQAKEDKAQEVKVLAKSKKTWDITASGKNDTIEYAGSGAAVITAGAGNDKISITGTGAVEVNGVSGRNTIIHTGSGDATLKGGTGKDTLQSYNANDVLTGGEGEDIFILTGVESHVTDFAYGTDKAIVTSATGALDVSKIKANSEGIISYTGNGSTGGSLNVEEQGYGDFYAVNLTDAVGNNKVNVGWTGENGGMINASSLTDKLLLLGNSNGSSDTLIGGQSRDTIVAGKGDSSLWGGAGSDLIESNGDSSNTIFFLTGDGNDTVTGFTTYDDSSSYNYDTLNFGGAGVTVQNTSEGIQFRHGNDKLTLSGNYTANTMIKWESGEAKGLVKVGKKGENNDFNYHEEVTHYLGSSGVDTLSLRAEDDNADIWLDGSQGTYYSSVEVVDASKVTGIATLAGDTGSNSLIGGQGANLLWGGNGSAKDVLYAGSGYNVFYYGKNEGNDIIVNTKADDEVLLYNMTLSDLRGASIAADKITLTQQNGNKLTVNGKAHEFTFADGSTWSADFNTKTWSQVK